MASSVFAIAQSGDIIALRKLVANYPAAIQARNVKDKTALHVAAAQGHLDLVEALITAGSAKDIADSSGALPLHLAAEQGHVDVVNHLLQGSGRAQAVKAKNNLGATPLHCAVRNGHADVCRMLVEAGAKPDIKDKAGQTALDLAAGSEAVLQALQAVLQPAAPSVRASVSSLPTASGSSIPAASAFSRAPQGRGILQQAGQGAGSGEPGRSAAAAAAAAAADAGVPELRPSSTLPSSREPTVLHTARGAPGAGAQSLRHSMQLPKTARGPVVAKRPPSAIPAPAKAAPGPAPVATSAAAAAKADARDTQLLQLSSSVLQLQEAVRQASERQAQAEAASSKAQGQLEAQLSKALETITSQGSRLEELESRLLFHEERSKENRLRIDKLEAGQQDLLGKAATQPSSQTLAAHENLTAAAIQSMTQQIGRLEATASTSHTVLSRASALQEEVDGIKRSLQNVASAQSTQAADAERQLQVLSASLATVNDALASLTAQVEAARKLQEECEAARKLQEEQANQQQQQAGGRDMQQQQQHQQQAAEPLHRPLGPADQPADPFTRTTSHRRTADAQVRPDFSITPPPSARAADGHAGSDPWATTPGSRGLGAGPGAAGSASFVQRLEFESSMQRVEERVREATEKEATAKKWIHQARETEEWRTEREQREAKHAKAIKALEADLEGTKLKVGVLESHVQDLQQLTDPSSPHMKLRTDKL